MEEREELKIEDLKNSASSRHMRSQSPAGLNFHQNFLKFGLWPEMSFQK